MNEKVTINEPSECPACSYALVKINDQLFCKNTACSAQINKKLEHFCKVLGIKGMGPKTIEKLQLQELSEVFYIDWEEANHLLGEKIAAKLQEEIEKAKSANLQTVLASLSIPLIGETAAEKLCAAVDHISEINSVSCKRAGLGEKATTNLLEWLEVEGQDLIQFLPFTFKTNNKKPVGGVTVCITGKLKSFKKKKDAEDLLAQAGFRLVDTITKTTSYLVDELGEGLSSKAKQAEKYGITIITDLNDLLQKKELNVRN